jgi:integrase
MAVARYLTPEERTRLLAELPNSRDQLMIILGLNTGLRITELLRLRWGQLVQADGRPKAMLVVARRDLKGGRSIHAKRVSSREIPLNEVAAAAIRKHAFSCFGSAPPPRMEEAVFRSRRRDGRPICREHAYDLISAAARRAGLDGCVGTHSLRRGYATDLYRLSGDLTAVQGLLGHRHFNTTAAYVQPRREQLFALCLKLGEPVSAPLAVSLPSIPIPKSL